MTQPEEFDELLGVLNETRHVHQEALEAMRHARSELVDFLEENPPKTFRLQEAYRNSDGSYSEPHWNEVGNYSSHSLIDQEELDEHILQQGRWTFVFHNDNDDPRPAYRRVIEVSW